MEIAEEDDIDLLSNSGILQSEKGLLIKFELDYFQNKRQGCFKGPTKREVHFLL